MMDVIILSLLLAGFVACFAEIYLIICEDGGNLSSQKVRKQGNKWVKIGSLLSAAAMYLNQIVVPGCAEIFPTTPMVYMHNTITLGMSGLFGRIFYTLDGTDPKISGKPYNGEIALHNMGPSVTVTARVRFLWKWSAPVSKTFYISTQHKDAPNGTVKFYGHYICNSLNVRLAEGTAL